MVVITGLTITEEKGISIAAAEDDDDVEDKVRSEEVLGNELPGDHDVQDPDRNIEGTICLVLSTTRLPQREAPSFLPDHISSSGTA